MHGFRVFQIWRKYDADSSGFISAAELRVSVETLTGWRWTSSLGTGVWTMNLISVGPRNMHLNLLL